MTIHEQFLTEELNTSAWHYVSEKQGFDGILWRTYESSIFRNLKDLREFYMKHIAPIVAYYFYWHKGWTEEEGQ